MLYDPESRVGGLAHVLLPDPTFSSQPERLWRYMSTAVPELVRELVFAGANRSRLRARLVGGASMFQEIMPKNQPNVGERNIAAARSALVEAAIPIAGEQVGGSCGRSVEFDLSDGRVRVSSQGGNRVEV
jgi:chemotaxis protein CheD